MQFLKNSTWSVVYIYWRPWIIFNGFLTKLEALVTRFYLGFTYWIILKNFLNYFNPFAGRHSCVYVFQDISSEKQFSNCIFSLLSLVLRLLGYWTVMHLSICFHISHLHTNVWFFVNKLPVVFSEHFFLCLFLLLLKMVLCRMAVEIFLAVMIHPYYFKFFLLMVDMRSSNGLFLVWMLSHCIMWSTQEMPRMVL